ncbi:replication initiator protein A [Enterococcus faecalis]|nr:replication initiator protein A [Enterococcus faecalis]MDN3139752.1 replication initiator protein A [Enterococcus faecalis]
MVFRSRLDLVIQRNQVDSQGFVYFEFTEQELAKVVNCSKYNQKRIERI